jgi:hypothetical protein
MSNDGMTQRVVARVREANGALNQIGYSARTTYDIRH